MDCAALNLFIGTNSSGKTSALQGLLFAGQNLEKPCGLNGPFLSMGSFEENRCVYSEDKKIRVTVSESLAGTVGIELFAVEDHKLGVAFSGESTAREAMERRLMRRNRRLQYLSCHRVGPQNVYKKNMTMEETIGVDGEYAIAYLNQHGTDVLGKLLCKGTVDYTLLGQVNWWLSYIAETEINTEELMGTDLVKASYTMNDVIRVRPVNIGSGISYLISILITCLSAPEESVTVIENPEIHLHPGAQAKLCEFLYFISRSGRQLFIESHSDHIFNGFRAGIAAGEMDQETINIEFFSLNTKHISEVMRVKVGRMGRIENQRKDLFDQFDIDLNKMIGLRRKTHGSDPE